MAQPPADDASRFSRLAERLVAGCDQGETLVVRRFTVQLVALARRRLAPSIQQKLSPEDVVQSVFRSFFRRLRNRQFDLTSWDGLWSLLVLITLRKCAARRDHYLAARRDVRRETRLPGPDEDFAGWGTALARGPRPEEAAVLAELVEQLLNGLNECERQILLLRLQGYRIDEICDRVGRADRTVRRVLARVRRRALRLTFAADDVSSAVASSAE